MGQQEQLLVFTAGNSHTQAHWLQTISAFRGNQAQTGWLISSVRVQLEDGGAKGEGGGAKGGFFCGT